MRHTQHTPHIAAPYVTQIRLGFWDRTVASSNGALIFSASPPTAANGAPPAAAPVAAPAAAAPPTTAVGSAAAARSQMKSLSLENAPMLSNGAADFDSSRLSLLKAAAARLPTALSGMPQPRCCPAPLPPTLAVAQPRCCPLVAQNKTKRAPAAPAPVPTLDGQLKVGGKVLARFDNGDFYESN